MRDVQSVLNFMSGGWIARLLRPGIAPIDPGTAILAAGGMGLAGSLISGLGTASAQRAANRTNAQIAQNAQDAQWQQYLLQRGINPGISGIPGTTDLTARYPELQAEYQRVQRMGDRRSFDQWLQDHIAANPNSYIAQEFAAGGGNVANTNLPLWATINGAPAEQALFNTIIARGGIGQQIDLSNPANYTNQRTTAAFLAANPTVAAELETMLQASGDTRGAAQWLADHVRETGDENFTGQLRAFAESQNAAAAQQQAQASDIPAEYRAIIDQSRNAIGRIYDGGYLQEELDALSPALAARLRLGEIAAQRNEELRGKTKGIYDAELLQADTYGDAALQAVNRVLAQQGARNAVRGFSGGSSGDDLLAARTLAPAIQAGAGARAAAGTNYTTRLAQILDADAARVTADAEIQNALDRLRLTSGDIDRRLSNVGRAGELYGQEIGLKNLTYDQQFRDIDATLRRIGALNTGGQVTPPAPVIPQVGSVVNAGQIAGSLLSNAGSMGMDYFTNKSLIDALNKQGVGAAPVATPAGNSYLQSAGILNSSGNFNWTGQ